MQHDDPSFADVLKIPDISSLDLCPPMHYEQFQLHADIEQRHWWFVGRRRILCRLVAEVLPPIAAKRVIVDVGCGTGGNIAALADRYRCVGIDTSAEAIELARQRFPHVRFIAGRAPRRSWANWPAKPGCSC